MVETKLYSGFVDLNQLEVGDSIADVDLSQWNFISRVPQLVADRWACFFDGSSISNKSRVGEAPMKDWQKGLGIIVSTELDIPIDHTRAISERIVMLRKSSRENSFGLYRSVNTRPIK